MTKLWFDEVKSNWQCNRLKTVILSVKNGIWGEEPNNDNNDIECVRIADFDRKKFEVRNKEFTIRNIPKSKLATYLLKKNDLLIEKSGGGEKQPVGFVVQYKSDRPAVYANFMARIEVEKSKVDSGFMKYVFSSLYAVKANLKAFNQTTGIQNLDVKVYLNELFVYPSLREQEYIRDFLDNETEYIDELILRKEKLISLLEERLPSIITEAVTKGLNSNVKLKYSGVEWIGTVPEHWNMSKVGYLGRLQNGISKSGDEFGYGCPFVSYGDVYKNIILPSQVNGLVNSSEEEQALYSVEQGDIFFTRTSETIEEIGFASVCLETIPRATFAGFLIKFKPDLNRISPNFAKYYFRSDLRRHYFIKEMNLVTRASLGQGLLRNFPVLLPSLTEQEEIADFLDNEVSNINNTISLLNTQIDKLKEYRQSIIYEAVTGKIDVCELITKKERGEK